MNIFKYINYFKEKNYNKLMKEAHKYEVIGRQNVSGIKVPVRTTYRAYSLSQARYLANKENISVKKVRDLGTLTEQNILSIRQMFGLKKK